MTTLTLGCPGSVGSLSQIESAQSKPALPKRHYTFLETERQLLLDLKNLVSAKLPALDTLESLNRRDPEETEAKWYESCISTLQEAIPSVYERIAKILDAKLAMPDAESSKLDLKRAAQSPNPPKGRDYDYGTGVLGEQDFLKLLEQLEAVIEHLNELREDLPKENYGAIDPQLVQCFRRVYASFAQAIDNAVEGLPIATRITEERSPLEALTLSSL